MYLERKVSMENILKELNEEICKGYVELEENNDTILACDIWLKAWETLKKVVYSNEIKSIEDFEENCSYKFNESLENWVQDLEMELENAASENEIYYKKRITYCKEFCERFPETDEFTVMSMKLAEAVSMFELGKKDKSEKLFKDIIKEYHDTIWPYVKWGDCYWVANILHKDNSLIDLDKAEEVYRKGLTVIDKSDKDILEERLEELLSIKKRIKK